MKKQKRSLNGVCQRIERKPINRFMQLSSKCRVIQKIASNQLIRRDRQNDVDVTFRVQERRNCYGWLSFTLMTIESTCYVLPNNLPVSK